MHLVFEKFDKKGAEIIRPWFDDPETSKYLGKSDWLANVFRLQNEAVGTEHRGAKRIAFHAFVVYHELNPVGFIDAGVVDRYVKYGGEQNGNPIYLYSKEIISSAISFVVDPEHRERGIGAAMIKNLLKRPEFKRVKLFQAGVAPENLASIRALEKAGFTSDYRSDFEGMLYFIFRI